MGSILNINGHGAIIDTDGSRVDPAGYRFCLLYVLTKNSG
jgi:hypothetical protein